MKAFSPELHVLDLNESVVHTQDTTKAKSAGHAETLDSVLLAHGDRLWQCKK